jgi:hypothetical protein
MADDPYSKWLGLPPGKRPPKAHELLGLPAKPTDAAQIDEAAGRRMDQLDQFALSNDRATRQQIQQLMNEVAKARTKLVGQLPKSKPKRDDALASKAPPIPPMKQVAAPAPPMLSPRAAVSAPVPKPMAQAMPAGDRSALQSAIVFWVLVVSGWAATLVMAYVVTFNYFKSDPLPSESPPVTEVVERDDTPPTDPDPGLVAGPEVIDVRPADPQDTEPETGPATPPDNEPIEPTPQELAEQERQATLAGLNAEKERRAQEQGRQEALKQEEAERLRQEAIKKQEAERLAEEQRTEEELLKQKKLRRLLHMRDRLRGDERVEMIRQMLKDFNGGIDVQFDVEREDDELVGLSLAVYGRDRERRRQNAFIADLSPLQGLKLKRINLSGLSKVKNLDALKGMPLEKLEFESAGSLEDILALKGMPITHLDIRDALIPDLEPLRGMPLEDLALISCENITSTAPLKGAKLRQMKFNVCSNLTDITGLESFVGPGIASFYKTGISDLSPLGGLTFGQLTLGGCNNLKSLDGLEGATMSRLWMDDMENLEDLSGLSKVDVTSWLEMGGPKMTDLTPLAGMKFRQLSLSAENLTSLKGIEKLPNLERLNLGGCKKLPQEEIERIKRLYDDLEVR